MTRIFLIMLYIFNVIFILLLEFLIIAISFPIWFCTFIILSIKNIIGTKKLIKQHELNKLKKMAEEIKLYSISFWLINFTSLFIMTRTAIIDDWGPFFIVFIFIPILIIYIILLGTSIFSISYIKILYKENKINFLQMLIHTILQLLLTLRKSSKNGENGVNYMNGKGTD